MLLHIYVQKDLKLSLPLWQRAALQDEPPEAPCIACLLSLMGQGEVQSHFPEENITDISDYDYTELVSVHDQ